MRINKNSYKIYSIKKIRKSIKFEKISIITVVYNGENTLEKTIKNVLNQDYGNTEYIVVYTPSIDSTFDIIKKYENKIDKILFNYDIGIYQSMNLGTKFASGKYINFMNSGDFFYRKNTISNIFKSKHYSDIVYGNCQIKYPNFVRTIKATKINDIYSKMFFSHQSCFVKTSIQKKIGFNVNYDLAADYDFFCKLVKLKKKFLKKNCIISICKPFGIVDNNQPKTLYQKFKIANSIFKKKNTILNFSKLLKIFYSIFPYYLRIILSKKLFVLFLKKKYNFK